MSTSTRPAGTWREIADHLRRTGATAGGHGSASWLLARIEKSLQGNVDADEAITVAIRVHEWEVIGAAERQLEATPARRLMHITTALDDITIALEAFPPGNDALGVALTQAREHLSTVRSSIEAAKQALGDEGA